MAQIDDKTKRVLRKWAIYIGLLVLILLFTFVLDRDTEHKLHQGYGRKLAAAIGAIITLGLYSFLFGENEVYRFLEHLIVGVVAALTLAVILEQTFNPMWLRPVGQGLALLTGGGIEPSVIDPRVYWGAALGLAGFVSLFVFFALRLPLAGWISSAVLFAAGAIVFERLRSVTDGAWDLRLLWLLAPLPGALWYTIFSKKHIWLSRVITVFIIGAYIGKGFERDFRNLISQLHGTLKPVWETEIYRDKGLAFAIWTGFGNLLFVVIAFIVLFYFVFTFRAGDHPIGRRVHSGSRLFMMIAFGIVFATVVGTRMGLVTDRIYFLVDEWAKPIVNSWF